MWDLYILVAAGLLLTCHVLLAIKVPHVAVFAAMVSGSALFYAGACASDTPLRAEAVVGQVLAVVIVLVSLIIVVARRPPPASDPWWQAIAAWVLLLPAAAVFLLLLAVGVGPVLGGGLLFWIILGAMVIRYLLRSRHSVCSYAVTTIGAAMRQDLPLSEALSCDAGRRTDKRARILRRIAQHLAEGKSLGESVRAGFPACPGPVLGMIVAGERVGQLPAALEAVQADLERKGDDMLKFRPVTALYPLLVAAMTLLMIGLLSTYILPQFADIFDGMGTELPGAARFVMVASDAAYPGMWVVLVLVVLLVVPLVVYSLFRSRRPGVGYPLSRFVDFVKWHLPIVRWFERNASQLRTVEALRLSLRSGATVNAAIANALSLDVNDCFRGRLIEWLQRVEQGEEIAAAARDSGVGAGLAWAFDAKVHHGSTPAILEAMESFYRSSYSYAAHVARTVVWPCVIILLGVMVGLIAYSLIGTMASLVRHANSAVMP